MNNKQKRIESLIEHLKDELGNSGADLLDELIKLLTK